MKQSAKLSKIDIVPTKHINLEFQTTGISPLAADGCNQSKVELQKGTVLEKAWEQLNALGVHSNPNMSTIWSDNLLTISIDW